MASHKAFLAALCLALVACGGTSEDEPPPCTDDCPAATCSGDEECDGGFCCDGVCQENSCPCVGDECQCVGDDCPCVGDDCPCLGDDCPCTDDSECEGCCVEGTCTLECACDDSSECTEGRCCGAGTCIEVPDPLCVPPTACPDPASVFIPPCADFTVTSPSQFAAVQAADCIGGLTIRGPAITEIPELPRVIQGDVTITNTAVVTATLPGLEEIRGNFSVRDNPSLVTLAPRDLGVVNRLFSITDNPLLELATFPFLACMAGGGPIFGNDAMRTLDFPVLGHLQTLEVRDNNLLTGINLPVVQTMGLTQPNGNRLIWQPREVTFYRLPGLTSLAMPQLSEVNARLTLEATGAASFELPQLARLEGLYIGENPSLATLDLSSLSSLSALEGWCPRGPGSSLSDECTPVYYVVDNRVGLTAGSAASLETVCESGNLPTEPAVMIDDSATRYACDAGTCECVLE